MAHLTMGELAPGSGQILADPFSSSMARLAQLRRIPGYGQNVLEKFGAALDETVLDGEMLRLKLLQEQALAPDPVASAFNALKNAYEEHDQFNIQRWEDAVERAGARRWLNRVRAMANKDRPLGYTTAGFWVGRGMSGLGALGAPPQYTFKRTSRGRINVYDQSGFQVGTVSEARARQMARAQAPTRSQRRRAAQRQEGTEWWGTPGGSPGVRRDPPVDPRLGRPVRNIRELRSLRQHEARTEARAAGRAERAERRAGRPSRQERRRAQQEAREKSRLRREEESSRQDSYSDDQLEQIRGNPRAPRWQRRLAERKLARRAYEALQAGRPKRRKRPRPEGFVFSDRPTARPFVVMGGQYVGSPPASLRAGRSPMRAQFTYGRRGGAIVGSGAPTAGPSYMVAVNGLSGMSG